MPETNQRRAINDQVEQLLAQMSVEEKIDYIGGHNEFHIRPVPRLGLPEIRMSDGPMGCRNLGPATAYPAIIGLAATWNPNLASAMGQALGRDCRSRGVHILLAPGVNIYRAPLCGRNFEYLGEDPFLTAQFCVPLIRGIQEQGVLATVKHFAANNQEYDRHHTSSQVDARTLREIYLPAFRAAVQKGRVGCVMNAYGLLNGVHCTQHDELNNRILKQEWRFDGILMSDWVATYDAVGAANGGLDLEMPSGKFMNREQLLPALRDGRVLQATIDEKVRRILRTIIRAGFLGRAQRDSGDPAVRSEQWRTALRIAREAVVMLRNEGGILPLDRKRVRKIAVIGPNAHPAVWGGGGSALTTPFRATSVLEALTALAGEKMEVHYGRGIPAEDNNPVFAQSRFSCITPEGARGDGLNAEYFTSRDLSGEPAIRRVDRQVDFNWGPMRPTWLPAAGFSVRWTGQLAPQTTGLYSLVARCDDGMRVWLDGELVIDDWSQHARRVSTVERNLEAGRCHDLKVEYYDVGGHTVAQFGWGLLEESPEAAAARLATAMDAVVLCVGFDALTEGEGADRPFELAPAQQRLIDAVSQANPNTIVVLFAGGAAVATEPWIGHVPAMLHAWLPGQEGGTAIAEILLGIVNPTGKLPMTFEKRWEENPAYRFYHGTDQKTFYRDGIFVGYRGFDRTGTEPLFCFGHGLSYTTFTYSGLRLTPEQTGAKGKVKISFEIQNTGGRGGAEVAQVYVGRTDGSGVERAVRELKGFRKVRLGKGQKKNVTVSLDAADLAYWDVGRNA